MIIHHACFNLYIILKNHRNSTANPDKMYFSVFSFFFYISRRFVSFPLLNHSKLSAINHYNIKYINIQHLQYVKVFYFYFMCCGSSTRGMYNIYGINKWYKKHRQPATHLTMHRFGEICDNSNYLMNGFQPLLSLVTLLKIIYIASIDDMMMYHISKICTIIQLFPYCNPIKYLLCFVGSVIMCLPINYRSRLTSTIIFINLYRVVQLACSPFLFFNNSIIGCHC